MEENEQDVQSNVIFVENDEDMEDEKEVEIPESSESESVDEGSMGDEDESSKSRKYQVDGKSRISELKREKYHAEYIAKVKQAEADQLRSEVERLRSLSEQSSQAAMTHFDDSVKLRAETAQQRLIKAIEEGDVLEQAKATSELTKAATEQHSIDSWKANQKYLESQKSNDVYSDQHREVHNDYRTEPEVSVETKSWLEENDWFNPNSSQFNPELANEVQNYDKVLASRYARLGQHDKIGSKEYFNEINRYVKTEIFGEQEAPQQRTLNMKQTRVGAAPVNNGGNQSRNEPTKVRLPSDFSPSDLQTFIKNLGVDEKEYIKSLEDDTKKQNSRMQEMLRQHGRRV